MALSVKCEGLIKEVPSWLIAMVAVHMISRTGSALLFCSESLTGLTGTLIYQNFPGWMGKVMPNSRAEQWIFFYSR